MKEGINLLPITAAAIGGDGVAATTSGNASKHSSSSPKVGLFGKGRYKSWALGAILLLALWSMLAGTVTLKWSARNLNGFLDNLNAPIRDDLDVLEVEEREKMVCRMWDVYADGQRIRLPRFWQKAFQAAYEELAGNDPTARAAAVAEIARMSFQMVDLEPHPLKPKGRKRDGWAAVLLFPSPSRSHQVRVRWGGMTTGRRKPAGSGYAERSESWNWQAYSETIMMYRRFKTYQHSSNQHTHEMNHY